MKRHFQGLAAALALLPMVTFAQSPASAPPASAAASIPGYQSVLKGYVRPEVPKESPDKGWLDANRALREDGGMDMEGMQMGTKPMDSKAMGGMSMDDKPMSAQSMNGMPMKPMAMRKPAASAPADPHAVHQTKTKGH